MDWLDWVLLVARVALTFVVLLLTVIAIVWLERKWIADMQVRTGPNRAGPWGIGITLADGVKLFFKEGIVPDGIDRPVYLIAPVVSMLPAFLAFAIIPLGPSIELFGREVPLQLADLNVGILWVLAMTSLAVYGVVLAGWASGSKYPLLGAIRSSAQMVSYEVGMGLALVAVLMWTGELSMSAIVASQEGSYFGFIPKWNLWPQFPAFLLYAIAALAETNRPPFDLPEAESELVAGYHTEYSGIKFAMFYLAEYLHLVTVSAIAVTLFLGGWNGPWFDTLPWLGGILWFLLKLFLMLFVYIWIRATIPRFRYDRLMNFGWKVLIPIGLVWILITGGIIVARARIDTDDLRAWAIGLAAGIVVLAYVWPWLAKLFKPGDREEVSA